MEYAMTLRHEFNEGKAEGAFNKQLEDIKNLINNPKLHCTPEDAMDILKVPQEDRNKYLDALKQ